MRIGFQVDGLSRRIATIWYRAFYPAVGLRRAGHDVTVFVEPPGDAAMSRLDAVIIVKGLSTRGLACAANAYRLSVPVYLDLCDDIFVPQYGKGAGQEAAIFKSMAALATGIITTGPVMAETLRRELLDAPPIHIVTDPAETIEDNDSVTRALGEWRRAHEIRAVTNRGRSLATRLYARVLAYAHALRDLAAYALSGAVGRAQ